MFPALSFAAYELIWRLIEPVLDPLGIPEKLSFAGQEINRGVLQILSSLVLGACGTIVSSSIALFLNERRERNIGRELEELRTQLGVTTDLVTTLSSQLSEQQRGEDIRTDLLRGVDKPLETIRELQKSNVVLRQAETRVDHMRAEVRLTTLRDRTINWVVSAAVLIPIIFAILRALLGALLERVR